MKDEKELVDASIIQRVRTALQNGNDALIRFEEGENEVHLTIGRYIIHGRFEKCTNETFRW